MISYYLCLEWQESISGGILQYPEDRYRRDRTADTEKGPGAFRRYPVPDDQPAAYGPHSREQKMGKRHVEAHAGDRYIYGPSLFPGMETLQSRQ